jgi:hypothetical protein
MAVTVDVLTDYWFRFYDVRRLQNNSGKDI